MKIDFQHRQSAHCESGVTANLFCHHGVDISEAMAFGLGGGLFFGYIPLVKVNHLPLTTFRKAPGGIFKQAVRRLGGKVKSSRFKDPRQAMAALDRLLEQGIPVGVQTGVYWLPYFPPALRFHFNAHNLVVYGKEGDDYLISDPVLDEPVACPASDLERARFAQGALAPKGRMYYLSDVPGDIDMPRAIIQGIREVCRGMIGAPVPIIGVRGIRFLAAQMEKWPDKFGQRKASIYLGHVIRMQEEIGTGGGGFRFIYAAFLQEAAHHLGEDALTDFSRELTDIGDRWREFALLAARHCKGREGEGSSFGDLADILRDCAVREGRLFEELRKFARITKVF